MDKFSVYIPKLLPEKEAFVSGRRSCAGCGKAMAVRFSSKALGRDAVFNSGDSKDIVFEKPASPSFGWDEMTFDELTGSIITGVKRGNKRLITEGRTTSEWVTKPAIALDRKILEGNYIAFSNLVEKGSDLLIVLYDNEPYMDRFIKETISPAFGIEYSHPVPGEKEINFIMEEKDLFKLFVADKIAYAASASVAYPFDLIGKIKKGMANKGTSLVLVHSPCPTGWMFPAKDTIKLAKLAVESRFFPLWEISGEKFKILEKTGDSAKVEQYLKAQGRCRTFKADMIEVVRKAVDREYNRLLEMENE